MDDRAGCALLIETARRLKSSPHEIYFVFTVQEELGVRGAKTSAYALNPDIGIAVDVTRTGDTPKARPMEVKLGGGPAIKIKDSLVMAHPRVRELMVKKAKEIGIPYQMEILEAGELMPDLYISPGKGFLQELFLFHAVMYTVTARWWMR